MKTVMYIFANKGLGMTHGKMAAQVAHAAVEAFRWDDGGRMSNGKSEVVEHWLATGYTKLVMEARDTEHMRNIRDYLEDKGFRTFPIIDEGRTETPAHRLHGHGC